MEPISSLLVPLCGCCKFGDCGQEVRHIVCPKRRAEMLRDAMGNLNRFKEGTQQAVREKIAEKPSSKMHPRTNAWIRTVEALSARVDEIPQGDLPVWKRSCCCYSYEVGDRIQQYLKEIEVILIHGMGGSGKTTLVRELTKKLLSKGGGGGFDFIFSILVSQNLDIHKIQGDILVQLGYKRDDQSLHQYIDDPSIFLEEKLNKRSFLLVLDDLWEPLGDLPSKLGFHHPSSSSSKKCKVVVTSRKAHVCEGRESIASLKIGFLGKEHAWELFSRKSGVVESDQGIYSLAKEVAEKCGGLLLLLKTVANAMAKKRNYGDWFSAKNQLHNYPDAIQNMDQVYERLKFSFDRLENDGLRVCLLYCALFPEDWDIPVDGLIPHLIAEGFVDGRYDFDTLWYKARQYIIKKLKESSLLERGKNGDGEDDDEFVKLHHAVRDMLLLLEGNDWKVLNCEDKGRDGRIDVDSWDGVRMASVWYTEHIEKIARCQVTLSSLRT